jgi:peptide deformylase
MSQIDEYSKKYNLRPGMGLAFVQVGVSKRAFVICNENDEGKFDKYIIINPEIISMSEEMIYVGEGEGCLSVNREVEGIVPRHARITIKAYDTDGKEFTLRVREDLAVAFQHEIDHLNGIMFTDHINPKCPYKDKNLMREI